MPAATPYHVVAQVIVYGLLMSGLFVATRTDFQAMVIPQVVLVGLVPVALIASGMGVLTISFTTSICGGALGYGSLWSLGKLCKLILKKEGLGVGDMELLGVLGLFTGPIGVWAIMLMSSLFGVLGALVYLLATGQGRNTRVPFGPFLAVATVVYLYAPAWFAQFLVG
jgi:leader peptidase (prepilin peptidase)/N-methyltransferase